VKENCLPPQGIIVLGNNILQQKKLFLSRALILGHGFLIHYHTILFFLAKRITYMFLLGCIALHCCRQPGSVTLQKTEQSDLMLLKRKAHYDSIIYPAIVQAVQTGDLVTRMGRDVTSLLLSGFNKEDSAFSHCGVIIIENDTPFVYHVIGGEFNPDQKMKRESLYDFSDPLDAKRTGVFHPHLKASEIQKLVTIITTWFKAGLPFDMDFNLDTDNRMYCTEMFAKAIGRATENRFRIESRKVDNWEFIPVENTYRPAWIMEKLRIAY
jgi:hypothetical protein